MRNRMLKRAFALVLTLALLVGLVPAGMVHASPYEPAVSVEEIPDALRASDLVLDSAKATEIQSEDLSMYADENGNVRVSIVLEKPSTFEKVNYNTENLIENASAMTYRRSLEQDQAVLTAAASNALGHELHVVWNLTLAANLISATVQPEEVETLRSLPGVAQVVPEIRYEPCVVDSNVAEPLMGSSGPMIGSDLAWNAGYTGAGQRTAIIDTGLATDHQSVNAAAFEYALQQTGKDLETLHLLDKEELAKIIPELNIYKGYADSEGKVIADQTLTADKLYVSSKIPFGYNYIDRNLDVTHKNDKQGGHGSHVAGIAAANRYIQQRGRFVEASEVVHMQGVAPDAQLLVMKVFGSAGGAYESDYAVAIEDAILLGCDSVNLSLGSAAVGFTSSAWKSIFDHLTQCDAVVTFAAGNSGVWSSATAPGYLYAENMNYQMAGSPGTYGNALTVASVDNDGATGSAFKIGDHAVVYSENLFSNKAFASLDATGTVSYPFVFMDNMGTKDDYNGVDVSGKIVMVSRGDFPFYEKWQYAAEAGAVACVIYNNEEGAPIAMDLSSVTNITIPCVSISKVDADWIKANSTQAGKLYTGTLKTMKGTVSVNFNSSTYKMSSFSSWGPSGMLTLKPEITAPGGSINSINGDVAGVDQYKSSSGTSMAAPQMAGLSALIAQYIEEKGLAEKTGVSQRHLLQSLLMSTANVLYPADSAVPYPVIQQGAGLANADNVLRAKSYLTVAGQADYKVKAELGDDPERTGTYTFDFTIHNFTDAAQEYQVSGDLYSQDWFQDAAMPGSEELAYYLTYTMKKLDADLTFAANGRPLSAGNHADVSGCDFNGDGSVDRMDAQLLLDYTVGKSVTLENQANADRNGDGQITAYDAELLLKNLGSATVHVPAGGEATVTVTANLTPEAKAELDRVCPNGALVEGYIYAEPVADAEGELAASHSIPVLAYYGGWDENPLFDSKTHSEVVAGNATRRSYFEGLDGAPQYGSTVLTQLTAGDEASSVYFGGNPYTEGDLEYRPERNALSSSARVLGVNYSAIRNLGDYRITVEDAGDASKAPYYEYVASRDGGTGSGQVYGAFYYSNAGYWYNMLFGQYTNFDLKEIPEGTQLRIVMQGAPEYYMQADGTVDWDTLDKDGTQLSISLVVDNTAPKLVGEPQLVTGDNGESLIRISFQDNRYTAAALLTTPQGGTILDRQAVNQTELGAEMTLELNYTGVWGSTFQVVLVDYAGNMTTYQVHVSEPYEGAVATLYGPSTVLIAGTSSVSWDKFDSNTNFDMEQLARAPQKITATAYGDGYLFYAYQKNSTTYALCVVDYPSFENPVEIKTSRTQIPSLTYNTDDGKLYYMTTGGTPYSINVATGAETNGGMIQSETIPSGYRLNSKMTYSGEANTYYGLAYQDAYNADLGKYANSYKLLKMVKSGFQWQCTDLGDIGTSTSSDCSLVCDANGVYIALRDGANSANDNLYTYDKATGAITHTGKVAAHLALFIPVEGEENNISTDTATKVTVMAPATEAFVGSSMQLSAEVLPWCLVDKSVTWSSSDETVATVDSNGMLTSTGQVGEVTVTATSNTTNTVAGTITVRFGVPTYSISAVGQKADGTYTFFDYDFEAQEAYPYGNPTDLDGKALEIGAADLSPDGTKLMVQDRKLYNGELGYRFHVLDPETGASTFDSANTTFKSTKVSRLLGDIVYLPDLFSKGNDYLFAVSQETGIQYATSEFGFMKVEGWGSVGNQNVAMAKGEYLNEGYMEYQNSYVVDASKNQVFRSALNYSDQFGWNSTFTYWNVNDLANLTFLTDESGRSMDTMAFDYVTKTPILLHYTGTGYDAYLVKLDPNGAPVIGKTYYGNLVKLGTLSGDYTNVSVYSAMYTGDDAASIQAETDARLAGQIPQEGEQEIMGDRESLPMGTLHSINTPAPEVRPEDGVVTLTISAEEAASSGMLTVELDENLTLQSLASALDLHSFEQKGNTITFGYATDAVVQAGKTLAVLTLKQSEAEAKATVTETERGGEAMSRSEIVTFPVGGTGDMEALILDAIAQLEAYYNALLEAHTWDPIQAQFLQSDYEWGVSLLLTATTPEELADYLEQAKAKLDARDWLNMEDRQEATKQELRDYYQMLLDTNEYDDAGKAALKKALDDGLAAIDATTIRSKMREALDNAKAIMDAVPTVGSGDDIEIRRTAAKAELQAYYENLLSTKHYTAQQKAMLDSMLSAGKMMLDQAQTLEALESALVEAKAMLDGVAEKDMNTLKAEAKEALQAHYDNLVATNTYTAENRALLDQALADGLASLDRVYNEAALNSALAKAKAALDAVETSNVDLEALRQEAKEELQAYYNNLLNTKEYTAEGKAQLETALQSGLAALDAATTEEALATALTNAEAALDAVPTASGPDDEELKKLLAAAEEARKAAEEAQKKAEEARKAAEEARKAAEEAAASAAEDKEAAQQAAEEAKAAEAQAKAAEEAAKAAQEAAEAAREAAEQEKLAAAEEARKAAEEAAKSAEEAAKSAASAAEAAKAQQAAQAAQEAAEAAADRAEKAAEKAEKAQKDAEKAAELAGADSEEAKKAREEAEAARDAAEQAQKAAEDAQRATEAARDAAAAHDAAAAAAAAEAAKYAAEVAKQYEEICNMKAEIAEYLKEAQQIRLDCAKYYALFEVATYAEKDRYYEAQQAELATAIEAGRQAISAATNVEAVNQALAQAKAAIDAIQTKEEVDAEKLPFTDVSENAWYYDAVKFVYREELFRGVSDTIFNPNGTMKRAMVVTVLYRLAGEPEVTGTNKFTDVKEGYYYDALLWATQNGIANGMSDTKFAPDAAVTREQMVAFLYRYAQYTKMDLTGAADLGAFVDADKVSPYAQTAMAWAVANGLVKGMGNQTLLPTGTASRAQVAQIIQRMVELG